MHLQAVSCQSAAKGAITSKIKHAIKLKTSPARLAQLLVRRHWLQAKAKC